MAFTLKTAVALAAVLLAGQAAAEVTFYENDDFQGRSYSTNKHVGNFAQAGFNDRASSVVVTGSRWEVCQDANFEGHCAVLRPGTRSSVSVALRAPTAPGWKA